MERAEAKVAAATRGGGVGAALAGVVLYLLRRFAFGGGEVPAELEVFVWAAVPAAAAAVGAYVAGYLAPHTPRPPVDSARSR